MALIWLHRAKKLANFIPLTLQFNRLKDVHSLVDQQFSYVRLAAPLLDTAELVLSFMGL